MERGRVIVTGAGGFIGRRVAAGLKAAGWRVAGVDRVVSADGEWVQEELPGLGGADGEAFTLVHLAWDMRRGDAEAQRRSGEIFRALLGHPNLRALVGLGSAEEYGGLEGRLEEGMAFGGALSAYGAAKHAAMADAAAWVRGGGRAVWLRPFLVYGEGQRGEMAIPYTVRRAMRGETVELSAAEQRRDFVHVEDVARGICAAAERAAGMEAGEMRVCNLGSGRATRLRDVLERAGELAGGRELLRFGARAMRAGEPQEQYADTRAAERELGWRANIGWEEGIARTVAAARREAEAGKQGGRWIGG